MKTKFVVVFFLAFIALAVLVTPAAAQSGKSVDVRERNADITILPNGDVRFVETWVVDFQNGSFTSAFREIPKNRLRDITAWGVREGAIVFQENVGENRFNLDETSDAYKITWRFPATNQREKFLSDVHTFELKYTVRGAMRIYDAGDQFWWKFVESDRAYPIEAARVTLHLPVAFAPEQIKTSVYVNGTETGSGRAIDGQTLEFFGGPVPPKTEWEIRAQFPHVLEAAPEEWQTWDDRVEQIAAQNNFIATVAFFVILIGGPLLLLVLWFLFGRDKPATFAAEFLPKPPDETPPGVVGALLDERADLQDILATMADLAQRGFLRIREADGFGSPVYERVARAETDLAPFEKATLDALLGSSDERTLDQLRGNFYYRLTDLKSALYREVVARGYFPASPLATREWYFRVGKWGALLVPILGFATACFTIVFAPMAFLPLCGLEVIFLGLLGLSRVMPQRTAQGANAAARWGAFRRYLANLARYTNVRDAQDSFAEYLPYAIAFGLEKTWIETFKQTETPAPKWYIPYMGESDARTWRDVDSTTHPSPSVAFGESVFSKPISSTPPASNIPLFQDSDADKPAAPNLDDMARGSFVGLNRVSGNMFDFLNSSASAFTEPPPRTSAVESFFGGVGDVLHWIGSSSGGSSSSDSSSSSSSSSSWSGGGSSGGSGSGGGSSGFG